MGCISSKAIAPSMSIREELNHGFQSKSVAWEELLTSHSGNDQLFAFLCPANTMKAKLRTSSFTLPLTDPETAPQIDYLTSSWDMIPDINRKKEVESTPDYVGEPHFGRFTRSKSCQILRENQTDGLDERKLEWKDKNLTGSRSFHTVEEFDTGLERIHNFSTRSIESSGEDVRLQKSNSLNDSLKKEPGIKNDLNLDHHGSSPLRNSDRLDYFHHVDGRRETGWKRKAAAKGLKSLDVPTTIEFPATARLRQRIHVEGQIYSPGSYITPKFGSYNARTIAPANVKEKEGGENSIFSPELVAAFEDCMQQLQEEEDSILGHLEGYSLVDDEMGNQFEESSTKHEN